MTDIKTVNIRGKAYVEVAERVRLVHDQQRPFELIESEPYTIGDRTLWRVTILVDEKKYKGSAEVKLNAPKNTPDGTNPFECAETSAVGRALAFAGFGTVESIASADEVARALLLQQGNTETQTRANSSISSKLPAKESSKPSQTPNANTSKPEPASKELLASARQMYRSLGREIPADLDEKSAKVVRTLMEQMVGQYRELTNKKNGHSAPTDSAHAPDVKSLRKRCTELNIDFDQLLIKVLKANIPDDNLIPESCAKLQRALDIVEEQRTRKKAS